MASAMPTASMPATMGTARPTGVTVLAVLYFVFSAIGIIMGLVLAAAASALAGLFDSGAFAALGAAAGVVVILFSALGLVVGWGLWTKKTWAWWIVVAFAALGLLQALLALLAMDIVSLIFGLAINGLIVWYMTSPGVQAWFGTSVKVPWHKTA